MVYVMAIWYILWWFGIFVPVLVWSRENNLATLQTITTRKMRRPANMYPAQSLETRGPFIEHKTLSTQIRQCLKTFVYWSRELCLFGKSLQFGKIWIEFPVYFVRAKILISFFKTKVCRYLLTECHKAHSNLLPKFHFSIWHKHNFAYLAKV
jgi:hypothetical protein